MGENTAIEWAKHTFNPWRGCVEVSEACRWCYAKNVDKRFPVAGQPSWGTTAPRPIAPDKRWDEPLKWDRAARKDGERHRVFTLSMGDLFEARPDLEEPRARLFEVIDQTPHLDWLCLTKRPEAIDLDVLLKEGKPRHNVWLGVTAENQRRADERIPILRSIPAAIRFLSIEPLLGQIDIGPHLGSVSKCPTCTGTMSVPVPGGGIACPDCFDDPHGQGAMTERAIDWVIIGGESGSKARPMHPSWAVDIMETCVRWGIPPFFKQWGRWAPTNEPTFRASKLCTCGVQVEPTQMLMLDIALHVRCGAAIWMEPTNKKESGRVIAGREWNEVPMEVAR